jgi:hypothetical protein
MEAWVKVNGAHLAHHDFLHDLPTGVEQSNPSEGVSALWQQDEDHPTHLHRDFLPVPNDLNHLDEDPSFFTKVPCVRYPARVLPGYLLFVPNVT